MIERVNKHTVQNWQCDKGDGEYSNYNYNQEFSNYGL